LDKDVLIVGGGIGGLTAALALAQRGYRVRVLEAASEFGAIGYGIQLGPNVFHMFERLGLSEAVRRVSIVPRALVMLDALDGHEVAVVPTGESFEARFKHPYIILHRIDLHHVLLDACKELSAIELVPSTAAVDFEDLGERVRVRSKDGRTFEAAAVIGADGLGSTMRAQMLAEGAPHFIGYVAHRTIVPMERVPIGVRRDDVVLWGGPGYHIVHYPLRRKTLFNVVAVFRTSTYAEKGDLAGHRAEIEKTYSDAQPAMKSLLAMMDLERRWAISDRDPIRHWHHGRVVLLGDAAHPTIQSLAQGACMAIEDAVCLAELIHAAKEDFATAFRRYTSARLLRTARVQLESRALWPFYHAEGIARDVRNATTAAWDDDHMFRCLAWLYDGFALPNNQDVSDIGTDDGRNRAENRGR
jgi:3-hydroxybenzoate 6-monooxygenase